jgi:hypothetical protein
MAIKYSPAKTDDKVAKPVKTAPENGQPSEKNQTSDSPANTEN